MSSGTERKTVILGGGLAGLTVASELARKGMDFLVVEKEGSVGGLAKTVRLGGFGFDIGGHRFYTRNRQVLDKYTSLINDQNLSVKRKSRIFIQGRYIDYPLRFFNSTLGLGLPKTLSVAGDLMRSLLKREINDDRTFEGWILNRYGRTIYDMYFRPYTEKVWGVPCTEISSDWIAQRINSLGLADMFKRMFVRSGDVPKTLVSEFSYPGKGIGTLPERLADSINRENIMLDAELVEVRHDGREATGVVVNSRGTRVTIHCNHVISTIPLNNMIPALSPAPGDEILSSVLQLKYRALVLVFLIIGRERLTKDTWTYFPGRDLVFGRMHEPGNWSPDMKQPGKTSLCLEIFCNEGDIVWESDPQQIIDSAINNLEHVGLLSRSDVITAYTLKVKNAYPVYRTGYSSHLECIRSYLDRFRNVHITGRTGAFRYHNMDDVWESSITLCDRLFGNDS